MSESGRATCARAARIENMVLHTEKKDVQPHGGQGRHSFYQHMSATFQQFGNKMTSGINNAYLTGKAAGSNVKSILLFAYVRATATLLLPLLSLLEQQILLLLLLLLAVATTTTTG